MKLQKLFIIATAASACAISAHATPVLTPPEIVITQTSDTTLTASVDGSSLTVVDLGADHWFVYGFGAFAIAGQGQWSDPDAAGDVNTVGSSIDQTLGLGLSVHADVAAGSGTPLANDTKDTADFAYVGIVGVNVTFNDVVGTTGNVPDSTTTLPLLGMAAGAMFGVARRMRK